MPINTLHPEYVFRQNDWTAARDAIAGETAVKQKRDTYLPVPPGMSTGSNEVLENGKRVAGDRYSFYLSFAEFPELIAPAVNGYQGMIHGNDAHVELPENLEYLRDDATPEGETLDTVWERSTQEILSAGRIGYLCDIGGDDRIRTVLYSAEHILNWRLMTRREGGGPSFVVLREVAKEPEEDDPFKMREVVYFRELRVMDGVYRSRLWRQDKKNGKPEVMAQEGVGADGWVTPMLFGRTFPFIPFMVQNATERGFHYEPIPIMALVRRALSIYRLTADYKRSLYIKGDPQVVISGITQDQAPTKIGGDSIWTLPNPQARAEYLDIDGDGIPLVRQAITDEYERFYQEGGRLLDTADRGAESGEALRRRQVANQVSLRTIAMNTGEGLELLLKKIADYMGEDPGVVKFRPDLDFSEPVMTGRDLLEFQTARAQGAPMSARTLHELMRRGRVTNLTFEQEQDEMRTDPGLVSGLPDAGDAFSEEDATVRTEAASSSVDG